MCLLVGSTFSQVDNEPIYENQVGLVRMAGVCFSGLGCEVMEDIHHDTSWGLMEASVPRGCEQ